jgi:hypothetical protein
MKSIGSFLKRLRDKKAVADAAKTGAGMGVYDGVERFEAAARVKRTTGVLFAAERSGAPTDLLMKLGAEATEALAALDQVNAKHKAQVAQARNEAEERDREGN